MQTYAWELNREDHVIEVMHMGKIVMTIGMCEAIESCHRQKVIDHITAYDNTVWLTRWQEEKHQNFVNKITTP